jgi:hypothetical protein
MRHGSRANQAAVVALKESLALAHAIRDPYYVAVALANLAAIVATSATRTEQAACLLGAADALLAALGAPREEADRAAYESAKGAARSALGEDRYASAWAGGQILSQEEAVAEALALANELANRLDA